jgi:hypothetical protein
MAGGTAKSNSNSKTVLLKGDSSRDGKMLPEFSSSTSLANIAMLAHRQGFSVLDNAFALIEGTLGMVRDRVRGTKDGPPTTGFPCPRFSSESLFRF